MTQAYQMLSVYVNHHFYTTYVCFCLFLTNGKFASENHLWDSCWDSDETLQITGNSGMIIILDAYEKKKTVHIGAIFTHESSTNFKTIHFYHKII